MRAGQGSLLHVEDGCQEGGIRPHLPGVILVLGRAAGYAASGREPDGVTLRGGDEGSVAPCAPGAGGIGYAGWQGDAHRFVDLQRLRVDAGEAAASVGGRGHPHVSVGGLGDTLHGGHGIIADDAVGLGVDGEGAGGLLDAEDVSAGMHQVADLARVEVGACRTALVEVGDLADHLDLVKVDDVDAVGGADIDLAGRCAHYCAAVGALGLVAIHQVVDGAETLEGLGVGHDHAASTGEGVAGIDCLLGDGDEAIGPDSGVLRRAAKRHAGVLALIDLIHHLAFGGDIVHAAVGVAKPLLVEHQRAVHIAPFERGVVLLLHPDGVGLRQGGAVGRGQGEGALAGTVAAELVKLQAGVGLVPVVDLVHRGDELVAHGACPFESDVAVGDVGVGGHGPGDDAEHLLGIEHDDVALHALDGEVGDGMAQGRDNLKLCLDLRVPGGGYGDGGRAGHLGGLDGRCARRCHLAVARGVGQGRVGGVGGIDGHGIVDDGVERRVDRPGGKLHPLDRHHGGQQGEAADIAVGVGRPLARAGPDVEIHLAGLVAGIGELAECGGGRGNGLHDVARVAAVALGGVGAPVPGVVDGVVGLGPLHQHRHVVGGVGEGEGQLVGQRDALHPGHGHVEQIPGFGRGFVA